MRVQVPEAGSRANYHRLSFEPSCPQSPTPREVSERAQLAWSSHAARRIMQAVCAKYTLARAVEWKKYSQQCTAVLYRDMRMTARYVCRTRSQTSIYRCIPSRIGALTHIALTVFISLRRATVHGFDDGVWSIYTIYYCTCVHSYTHTHHARLL